MSPMGPYADAKLSMAREILRRHPNGRTAAGDCPYRLSRRIDRPTAAVTLRLRTTDKEKEIERDTHLLVGSR
ncbi:hypothetical protein HPB47_025799, partial [Ixodes persulcatus]